jgi:hypothetical protein
MRRTNLSGKAVRFFGMESRFFESAKKHFAGTVESSENLNEGT